MTSRHNLKPALTLLELVVAVSLFAILTLAATRVFLRVMDVQGKMQEQQTLEGDFRYAINVFVDEVNKAKIYNTSTCTCDGYAGCDAAAYFCQYNSHLCLTDANNTCIEYFLSGNQLQVKRAAATYTITSRDIVIDNLSFVIAAPTSTKSVSLRAKLRANENNGETMFYQTTITK